MPNGTLHPNHTASELQHHKLTFRRVAYHTEQTVNSDGGGDKYWQIMRGSAAESPERNGRLGRKVDISATEDRARNGARSGIRIMYFDIFEIHKLD